MNYGLHFDTAMVQLLTVTIKMNTTEQYSPVLLFNMLCKVILTERLLNHFKWIL